MRILNCYQVDVFAESRFQGNPASVVWGAEKLSASTMLKIAKEFNNSETAFIQLDGDVPFLRFFTINQEIKACGHATLAAARVYKEVQGFENKVSFQTKAGVVEVVERGQNLFYSVNEMGLCSEINEKYEKQSLLTALGIQKEDLIEGIPIQSGFGGSVKLIVPVKEKSCVLKATPNFKKLGSFCNQNGVQGIFLIAVIQTREQPIVYGRVFVPQLGLNEDLVNGNSCIPLAIYLDRYRASFNIESNFGSLVCYQGETFDRNGKVLVNVTREKEAISTVHVGGEVLPVLRGKLFM